jgi:hypothetical protein
VVTKLPWKCARRLRLAADRAGPGPLSIPGLSGAAFTWLYFGREFQICQGSEIGHFGGLGGPGGPGDSSKGWGASPPTFCKGLRGPRCRPDSQNGRFPILVFFTIQSAATFSRQRKYMHRTGAGGSARWASISGRHRCICTFGYLPARAGRDPDLHVRQSRPVIEARRLVFCDPGFLKAVWPDFMGSFSRSGRPRGPGKAFKSVGGRSPPHFGRPSRAPGSGQTSKTHPTNPARLPSGTQKSKTSRWSRNKVSIGF